MSIPLLDKAGKPILLADGEPAVEWAEKAHDLNLATSMTVKGFGIEFSIGKN
jgi:hypothetical protein